MHIKYKLLFLYQRLSGMPLHKTIVWNSKVWDGQTRNDFQRGRFVEFLYKVGAIKQLSYYEDDGRGYFIGYSDEDDI
jgi:hypothetical protein